MRNLTRLLCVFGLLLSVAFAQSLDETRKKAESGDADAQFNLGLMYANGDGVPKDSAEAVKWYRKSAEQGSALAQTNLGLMYANGTGVPKDAVEAVKWYRLAAEQGLDSAQFTLGVMYANGTGVPKDAVEAVKWFRKSAEQGNAAAQFNLGWMYDTGNGVPKDEVEAVKWYRKAAEQGEPIAEFALGEMYANGRGVPKNETEAVKWYRKAAEQRLALAQMKLGDIYVAGKGVAPDFIEAHAWFNIAGASGHPLANLQLNIVQQYLTPLAIAEATDLARERLKAIKLRPQPWLPNLGGDLVKPVEDIASSPPDKPVKDAHTLSFGSKPVPKLDIDPKRPRASQQVVKQQQVRPAILTENKFGTANIGNIAVDAKWSNYGAYLQRMIDTVQVQWERILIENKTNPPSGSTVTVRIVLNSEGRIAQILEVANHSTDQGSRACVSGITDRAPYGPWTDDMKAMLGESQEMTFTFYYQ